METLTLDLGHQSLPKKGYSIWVGQGAIAEAPWASLLATDQVAIVTDDTLPKAYLEKLNQALSQAGCQSPLIVTIPAGEQEKSLENANNIWSDLLKNNFRRNATLIALGGGVIGDLTGFVAATYQRGMAFIQVPTTLLAQVDSSVGGKTAINHSLGKNMVGAFHQPIGVVSDLDTFKTLPKAEFAAGMAEVIKYGLILDADFFKWLLKNAEDIANEFDQIQDSDQFEPDTHADSGADADDSRAESTETPLLTTMIKRCCELKAALVQQDETEQGTRAYLNLGHTFGHAIEAHVQYQGWRHGEAVAVGLRMALDVSWRLGQLSASVVSDTHALLDVFKLPIRPPKGMTSEDFLQHMRRDKKRQSDAIRLVLLKSLGEAEVTESVSESKLHECLQHFCSVKR